VPEVGLLQSAGRRQHGPAHRRGRQLKRLLELALRLERHHQVQHRLDR
jgi:hypothetical protein